VSELERLLGRKAIRRLLPMAPGDVFETCADTQQLHDLIGYAPGRPLSEGLAEFVNWYLSYCGYSPRP
jgi:UDP-glucuronate 4-epimerase